MILDESGRAVIAGPRVCQACGGTQKRQLTTGFGGHWSVHCLECGAKVATGRGEPPAEGEY